MADRTINDLTQAESIGSEDLFVLQQNSEAKKLKGAQLVKYAQDAVGAQVTAATQAAENAAAAKTGAESAQTEAQAARDAILNMIVEAITLESGAAATVDKSLVDAVYKLTFGLPRGEKGAPGATGPANTLAIGTVTKGTEAAATITGDAPNQTLNLVLPKGDTGGIGDPGPKGDPGNGIASISLKSGSHAPGTTDTYEITFTDGTTFDFLVYNGADGAGSGDMKASVYDPQGKAQDIFAYVDNAVSGVTVTTDATPTQGSTNPVQSGGVYTALANKLDKTGDGSNVTAAFTAATARANIATGEKLSVLFGKIAKWFSDLGSLAFKSSVAKTDLEQAVQNALVPSDGTTGQVLTKTASGQEWAAAPQTVTIPETTALLKGDGAGGVAAAGSSDYLAGAQTYTATLLSTGWAADGSYQKQTVTVTGLKANYPVAPVVDAQLSGTDADGDAAILTAFSAVNILHTAANQLIAYCIGYAPDTNIPLIINTWG